MPRTLVPSSSPYAAVIGFSRAVRVGNHVVVGGTAPLDPEGRTVAPGDAAGQMRRCLEIVREALEASGATLGDVVRTRTYLARIADWPLVATVRAEYFGDVKPVDTV